LTIPLSFSKSRLSIGVPKTLAPHTHIALRGSVWRADLRQVIAATCHQVWWPPTHTVRFDGDHLPVWHEATGCYIDPATGEVLPTWDQAPL
jgi:hypothetical protein